MSKHIGHRKILKIKWISYKKLTFHTGQLKAKVFWTFKNAKPRSD